MKAKVLLLFLSLICSLLLAEYGLLQMGFAPGMHSRSPYFTLVDSLFVKKGFATDSIGIIHISKEAQQEVRTMVAIDSFSMRTEYGAPYYTAQDAIKLRRGQQKGELHNAYFEAISTATTLRTAWQNAVIQLVDSVINSDGYRSIPFRPIQHKKPSVLLIGDSFTQGHSASSLHFSFSDLLLARGYTVYNAGITGTDVAQYLAVAAKWIPILRPDIVITNVYMGNDIAYFKRVPRADFPLFYQTNAGFLMTCPEGVELKSPEEAYAICQHWIGIPQTTKLGQMMSATATTSALWGLLWKTGIIYSESEFIRDYYSRVAQTKRTYPYCKVELGQIDSIAKVYGARPIVSVIPDVNNKRIIAAEDLPAAFEGMPYNQMPVTIEDYVLTDGHFNDRGHARYADFLQALIDGE